MRAFLSKTSMIKKNLKIRFTKQGLFHPFSQITLFFKFKLIKSSPKILDFILLLYQLTLRNCRRFDLIRQVFILYIYSFDVNRKGQSHYLQSLQYPVRYQSKSCSLPKFFNATTLHLMASTTSSIIAQDSNQQLIAINVSAQAPLKLNATNYLSWKLRFNTLFIGYDLIDFIDCSKPCLTPTIAIDSKTINQAYTQWERKHQLIFNVLECV